MTRQLLINCVVLLGAFPQVSSADESPVADAAERGDVAAVVSLIAAGQSVQAAQIDGMTALHWAVRHDDEQLVQALVKADTNVGAKNRYDVTPLSIACENGNAAIVELLLKSGADANTALPGGETVLMTAARNGRLAPVKSLLKHGADVNRREHRGQTALMWAAAEGYVEVVDALLNAGADFKTPLKSGFTPFFFAVREGRKEVVKRLLEQGIDVNSVMPVQQRPANGPQPGMSALPLAIENGHFELAVELLKAGADPNDQRCGFTPLHIMTWVRKPNLGDGPDGAPSPEGSGKLTSLQMVRELVAHGADVNGRLKRNPFGRSYLNMKNGTAFLLASKTADLPLMRLLLELGADPLLRNDVNSTALMAAAGLGTKAAGEEAGTEEECLEAVKLLLSLGCDVNAVDSNGETAMHGAAYKNLPRMVHLLTEHGAKIDGWNKKNDKGWTPLLIAEGHRFGNFKPSASTIAAIHDVMRANGLTPPPPTPRKKRKGYLP